jgi:methionyl-tRNA formyltransferase
MSNQAKIFFMGVTEFGLVCFDKLIQMGLNLVGCAYTEDRIIMKKQPNGMKNVTYVDFNALAKQNQIEAVFFDRSAAAHFEQRVKEISPDLIIVAGWHYIIKSETLNIPRLGTVGLHSSLLPKYRGGSPLVWQLINGEKESGVSLFYIEDGIDTGDIIGQERFFVNETDTIKDALLKSQQAGLYLLDKYVPQLLKGTAPRVKQNEKEVFYVKQRTPLDGEINWDDTPQNIKNFIKAQTKPYPGAFTIINNKKVYIWDADIFEN